MSDTAVVSPPSLPRLITARELALALGLSTIRIYELTRAGEMPHIRFGRSVRFDVARVSAWLDAGGTASSQEG